MSYKKGKIIKMEVWPFIKGMFDNSRPAAWIHEPGNPNGPLIVQFQWEGKGNDEFWIRQMKTTLSAIHKVAVKEGCVTKDPPLPVYLNTALEDTPVKDIYQGNLDDLGKLRSIYDPHNVMGLTGGFRIPVIGSGSSGCQDWALTASGQVE
jgi:hypothetical protein